MYSDVFSYDPTFTFSPVDDGASAPVMAADASHVTHISFDGQPASGGVSTVDQLLSLLPDLALFASTDRHNEGDTGTWVGRLWRRGRTPQMLFSTESADQDEESGIAPDADV